MLICTFNHGVAYATVCALRYGYKCKHLLLLFFEPVEAKFNLEQATKAQRGSKCTALPVDPTKS